MKKVMSLALTCTLATMGIAAGTAAFAPQPAQAAEATIQNGVLKSGKSYYVYKKGKLLTKSGKVGKSWYAVTPKGKLRGYMTGSWCHYADGGYMSYQDSLDFKAFARATIIANSVTNASDSKATKRLKVFRWVMAKYYAMHRSWNPNRVAWPAVYAFDHFDNKGGDCHSDGAAFAYLAQAVGYGKAVVCTDSGSTSDDNHCWAMIGGAVYDPLFAQSKSFGTYYNSRHGSYEVSPTHTVKICQWEKKHGKAVLPKKIKNEWLKQGGYWYYKLASGKNAVGSVKNKTSNPNFTKGAYYVFSKKGRLLEGSGTRVVKVGGASYQVAKTGRAKKGWSADRTRWFTKKGLMVTGLRAIKGRLWLFSDDGALDADESTALKGLGAAGADYAQLASELRSLGAKVKSTVSQRSCDTYNGEAGDNVIYVYKAGFEVHTFKTDSGAEYVTSVE